LSGGGDRDRLKRMADLLRSGATMLTDVCPECGVPLFRLRSGEVVCPECGRRAVYVGEASASSVASAIALSGELEEVLHVKLAEVVGRIRSCGDLRELYLLVRLANAIIELLGRVREFRSGFE